MKAIKLRIYPNLAQRKQLTLEFGVRRHVWNWALERRSSAYELDKTSLNSVSLSRELTVRKGETPFLKRASSTALQNTLKDLDDSFDRFFKKQTKYPKPKKFGTVNSVKYQMDKRQKAFASGECLKLPKLGKMKVIWSQDVPVFPNSATISKDPRGRWFVSLQIDWTPEASSYPSTSKEVGIDLGLTCFAALSDGTKIYSPKPLKHALRKLKYAQRAKARCARYSKNSKKMGRRVSRLHTQIADKRQDFLHKLSTSIVAEHGVIAVEDLFVAGMLQNRKLSRSISDASWGAFRAQITYKAKWAGRDLRVTPRFTRSTGVCPCCDLKVEKKLTLDIREWTCAGCGALHDRDSAAARIILKTARRAGLAC